MRLKTISFPLFLLFVLLVGTFALAGVPAVPFHPDESTALYLSSDFEDLWQRPRSLAWQPNQQDDPKQHYRTLDAPLSRTLAGFGRWLAGLPALPMDWVWGKTWEENRQAGAMPSDQMLYAARYAVTALLPLSLVLLFLTARRAAGERAAWLAAILLATNALVLLHGRRAMSEGAVIFTTCLTLWSLTIAHKRPWVTGMGAALAFCAKHTLGALAPVALLASVWQPGAAAPTRLRRAAYFTLSFLAIVLLLNPFLWAHPSQALQAAAANRADLADRQSADRPGQGLNSPGMKLVGLVGGLYLTPPLFAETGNYTAETASAESAYLANPLHTLLNGLVPGTFLFLLGCFGYAFSVRRAARQKPLKPVLLYLLLATLLQALALFWLVPLPFQRYYIPLVPHACLWAAFGLDALLSTLPFRAARRSRGPARHAAHLLEK